MCSSKPFRKPSKPTGRGIARLHEESNGSSQHRQSEEQRAIPTTHLLAFWHSTVCGDLGSWSPSELSRLIATRGSSSLWSTASGFGGYLFLIVCLCVSFGADLLPCLCCIIFFPLNFRGRILSLKKQMYRQPCAVLSHEETGSPRNLFQVTSQCLSSPDEEQ